jgi:hypothetical protein
MACIKTSNAFLCEDTITTKHPQTCNNVPQSTCSSSDPGYNPACTCGFNKKGTAYCDLAPGDSYYKTYLGMVQDWIKTG